jgi:hypothetical protein
LRSVQPTANKMLLVGAQRGVMLVDSHQPSSATSYADGAVTSQLGFNRAVIWRDEIWASHSEAGIVGWKQTPGTPYFVKRPAELAGAGPKNLQVLDANRLVFSTPNRLMLVQREGTDGAPAIMPVPGDARSEIIALLPDGDRLIVVLKSGVVQTRDAKSLSVLSEHPYGGELCAAALMPWLGSTRLLLATDDGPIHCVGLDDGLMTQYLNPFGALRTLAASSDLIAGLSGDRQRVLLWQPWSTRQASADVFVTAVARHRVADVDI